MAEATAANRFVLFKAQTAHGTRAAGMTQAIVPMRNGSLLDVNPTLKARADAINMLIPFSGYYPVPKIVGWQAAFYLTNPTVAHTTVRDILKGCLGKETTAIGPPITKQYDYFDIVDAGTDGTPVNTNYGRCLTIHEQADKSDGTAIYSHEVQDATVESLKITWTPTEPLLFECSGMGSELLDGPNDITPVYPDGQTFDWRHARDTATAGLRIGSANPPVAADNLIYQKAVFNISQKVRYEPFLGAGTAVQVRRPIRDDQISVTVDVTMSVEDAQASQYESATAIADWKNQTAVNLDFFTYIDVNNILEIKASAATKACFWETWKVIAQGWGAMQWQGTLRLAPAALADSFIKLTTFS